MKKKHLFEKAERLRQNGYSLREISEKLDISKSTASNWLKTVQMSETGIRRLDKLAERGEKKARLILAKKRKDFNI